MKFYRLFYLAACGLLTALLVACGGEATTAPATTTRANPTTGAAVTTAVPTTNRANATTEAPNLSPTAPGSRTALAFFTPTVGATTPPTTFTLAFDNQPGQPTLEALIVSLPQGKPDDWEVVLNGDGVVKYTKNPSAGAKAQMQNRFLNVEKQNTLLQEMNKLGVLDLPETTTPPPGALPSFSRSLSLNLKGRAKTISDLSGKSDDKLGQLLNLVRQTVEAAPLRNSP